MNYRTFFSLLALLLAAYPLLAQDDLPDIHPTAYYTGTDGIEVESASHSGNAPMSARFVANAENTEGWSANYEWHFSRENEATPYLIRYEEDTQYTFTEAGAHIIQLYAVFVQGNDTIAYTDDYWAETEPLRVTINESKLEMPNATDIPEYSRVSRRHLQPLGTEIVRMG